MEGKRRNPFGRGEQQEIRDVMFREGESSNPVEDLPATIRFSFEVVCSRWLQRGKQLRGPLLVEGFNDWVSFSDQRIQSGSVEDAPSVELPVRTLRIMPIYDTDEMRKRYSTVKL